MTYAAAKADVEAMIDASSITITVFPSTDRSDGFYPTPDSQGAGASAKAVIVPLKEDNPTLRAGDVTISVKASVDIHEDDRVTMSGETYMVTNVFPQDLFGTVTHQDVVLSVRRAS